MNETFTRSNYLAFALLLDVWHGSLGIELYALERKLLIPRFQEPRIHFAINCASRSCPPLRPEAYTAARLDQQRFYDIDLFVRVPKLLIPVYFFQGRYDHLVSLGVAERYFQNLEAPSGKRFVWFEKSGHWPQFEQAKNYREEIQSVLLAEKRKKTDCRFLSD